MFGLSGLFGGDGERRQVNRYLERHGDSTDEGPGQG
jgi:hypothetical protein